MKQISVLRMTLAKLWVHMVWSLKNERQEAENMFSSKQAEEEAKKESTQTFISGEVPDVIETSENDKVAKSVAPTPEQIIAIKAAIVNSQTLEEVAKLEQALKSGQLPAEFNIPGDKNDNNMDLDAQNEANTELDNTKDKQLDSEMEPIEED